MKKIVFILFIISTFNSFAQNLDLVVTGKGDSIACHIDSITETHIYFKMKVDYSWTPAYTSLNNCTDYKIDAFDEKIVVLKPGSSYIKKITKPKLITPGYDLLINTKGDSIACHIDSITDSHIYFEMKLRGQWIHTKIIKTEVVDYKRDQFKGKVLIFKEGSSYIEEIRDATRYFDRNLYANRYLFAPSAFPMKESLFSYSNITLGLHDFRYGVSDRFSLGFGTTMLFFPIYIMPSYSIPINEESSFAIGDLMLLSPYADLSFFGNLLYGMYTKGSAEKNFSIGLGLWTTIDCDLARKTFSPAINFSAMLKTSYNSYFITEFYAFQYNMNDYATYFENDEPQFDEDFLQAKYIAGGISGFRIIGKNYPRNSWQFALAYIFIFSGDFPDKYDKPYWRVNSEDDSSNFTPWPIISYTRIF